MNKTELILLMKFEAPTIPLDKVCEEYFGCSKNTAKLKAKSGQLPVPAFRLGDSQKLPWMIHVQDLANFIDEQYNQARSEWSGSMS